jgi:hypothetical protein
VSSLERELRTLAADVFPETPDIARAVAERVRDAAGPRRHVWRTALVVALAVIVVALGAAFAVPDARSAILRWLGIEGVRVEFVDKLPPVAEPATLPIGTRVTLAEARRRVAFGILLPSGDVGSPDGVYVGHFNVDEVTLLYGTPTKVRLLLTEVAGRLERRFATKMVDPRATLRQLVLDGKPALWIEGAPHEFLFVAPNGQPTSTPLRLDKNTLLWQRGRLFLRLEGDLTLAEALRVARSLR